MPKKMVVPYAYIKEVLDDFVKSDEGKAYIKQETGLTYDPKFTRQKANSYVQKAARIIFEEISGVIKSFQMTDLIIGEVKTDENGRFYAEITLNPAAIRRDSLYPEKYPEGIENIVLHFAHGWNANGTVYGSWHGKVVPSRETRSPNDYLKNAVLRINTETEGVLTAELASQYMQ